MSVPASQHSAAPASTSDAVAPNSPPESKVFWTTTDGLDPAALRRLTAELSQEEARQARAFHFARDRATYIAAHAMLRRVLRDTLGGKRPRFVRTPLGRPELKPRRGCAPTPSFNLTHSGDFAACAIFFGAPVGIDAEDTRRPINVCEMAARWFAPAERQLLEQLPETHQTEMFFRIWTLKEAIVKATGHGLRIEPQLFTVDPDRRRAVIAKDFGIPTRWRLAELTPMSHIRLALAVPGYGQWQLSLAHVELG
jgi:4'-phosphopantetheinyl transferase